MEFPLESQELQELSLRAIFRKIKRQKFQKNTKYPQMNKMEIYAEKVICQHLDI